MSVFTQAIEKLLDHQTITSKAWLAAAKEALAPETFAAHFSSTPVPLHIDKRGRRLHMMIENISRKANKIAKTWEWIATTREWIATTRGWIATTWRVDSNNLWIRTRFRPTVEGGL